MRDVPWEGIFKLSIFAAPSDFCDWVQVRIDVYISSLRNLLWHSAIAEAFAEGNLHFFECALANYCRDKVFLTTC